MDFSALAELDRHVGDSRKWASREAAEVDDDKDLVN
jgi:hypothetical protein